MGDGSEIIDGLYYSKEHEYVKIEGDLAVIGITDHAQNALHEITYVEIKDVGTTLSVNEDCGLVESMKASSDIFTPIGGELVEVNTELENSPEIVNESPYVNGWLFKIKPSNLDDDLKALMDSKAYHEYVTSL
ncbi:MAG: glycine cleavage system protein GcvH [Candidatus Thorarchaeota archaeon]